MVPVCAWAQGTSVAEQESNVTGGTLMLICYMVLWVMLVAFFVFVLRKQSTMVQSVDDLRTRMGEVEDAVTFHGDSKR